MPKRNIVWIVIGAVIAVLLWKAPENFIRRDALYNKFGPLLDVRLQIVKHYVDEVKDEELLRGAIDGMINRLDPYSAYFSESEYREFESRTNGEFPGIGVLLESPPGVGLVVVSPMEGTPAFRAGLRPGDRITHVDGVKTAGLILEQCVKMISGPAGTKVVLTIQRPGVEDPFDVTITRCVVNVPTVRGWARSGDWKWDYLIDPQTRIGYIRIMSFESKTAEQLHDIITDLLSRQRMRGLILDVRNNPGGLLDAVVTVANRFLTGGKIVSTKSRNQPEVAYMATGQDTYPDFPVAILVNNASASASEILAGALRDHHRAVVVGEKTYGKGSVQEFLPIENNNGKIKLTMAYFYLPNGERIHGKGISPDRIVDLTPQEREKMRDSWMAVYSGSSIPPSTLPAGTRPAASSPAATGPADTRNASGLPAGTRPASSVPAGLRSPPATQAAATSVTPAADQERFEIYIDAQLGKALEVVREKIRTSSTRPA